MRYSQLFGKTSKTISHETESVNARFLLKGGFIDQLMAGVYTYLPLGFSVLQKIKNVVREEMLAIGAQEMQMPALHPKEPWETTGRWSDPGQEVMFRCEGREGKEYGLGWTHEEIITPLAKKFIQSYKDLPLAVFQIQNKFRNEPRAKSGLLRGREFSMKDLYSFHATEADLAAYYEKVKEAYNKIFARLGLRAILTEAAGGAFSKYSHEFQVLTESGEDIIFYCGSCEYAQNREISEYKAGDKCPKCGGTMKEGRAIEVGNIFELKTRFTDAFDVAYLDAQGKKQSALMGCYGIGPSRLMGAIVETHHDEKGIVWPKTSAPYNVVLVSLSSKNAEVNKDILSQSEKLARELEQDGASVLLDDRNISAGEKFADADLIGVPLRLVISEKTLAKQSAEWKERDSKEARLVSLDEMVKMVKDFYRE